jgi:hypothetical protein
MGKRKRSSGDHNKNKYNSSSGNVSVLSSSFLKKNDFVVVWLPDKMVRNEAKKGNFES